METTAIKFDISPSDPAVPLGVEVWIDSEKSLDISQLTENTTFSYDFDDDKEHTYTCKIILKNKLPEYTKIDDQGNIVKDSYITVSNFLVEEIDVSQVISKMSKYSHDFNGTGRQVVENFYGNLGCNGTVSFEVSTPSYLWLLEHI